jgi:hypothetical protein
VTKPNVYLDYLKNQLAEETRLFEQLQTKRLNALGTLGDQPIALEQNMLDALWKDIKLNEKIISYLSKMK